MKQKDVFLESEGNAWFKRNRDPRVVEGFPESDPLLSEIVKLPVSQGRTTVLEIGCSDGIRLEWLMRHGGFDCYGVDPSAEAVSAAKGRGIHAYRETADKLPFEDRRFDIVLFGFCLYLCDREDLFRIACEADRVLKNPGWLLILDFFSPSASKREYHHYSGLFSYKMDYRTLFSWHPAYANLSHTVRHHVERGYTDDRTEWIATSVLRKNSVA